MYLSSDYSDLTIICGNKTIPAHRIIVCARSPYFRTACDGQFKVKQFDPLEAL